MENNKDPITCPNCGTVNPWLNENCRDCGTLLTNIAEEEEPSPSVGDTQNQGAQAESQSSPNESAESVDSATSQSGSSQDAKFGFESFLPLKRRRWNIQWMLIGMFLYFGAMWVGTFSVEKWIMAPDPQLRSMAERMAMTQNPDVLSDEEKEKMRSLLFSNNSFVFIVLLLFFGTPILIGGIVGRYAPGILEGAASMGISAVIFFINENQAAAALIAGPLMAGLGAVGAWGSDIIRRKMQQL